MSGFAKYCSMCGSPLNGTQRFCAECGAEVRGLASSCDAAASRESTTIEKLFQDGVARDVSTVVSWMIAAMVALEGSTMHVRGSITPTNLLVCDDGNVLIGNFDAAPMAGAEFAAPELEKSEVADERADVYSLGAIAWMLLSGRRPLGTLFSSLSIVNSDVSSNLAEIIATCVKRDPARRYQTLAELREALEGELSALEVKAVETAESPVFNEASVEHVELVQPVAAAPAVAQEPATPFEPAPTAAQEPVEPIPAIAPSTTTQQPLQVPQSAPQPMQFEAPVPVAPSRSKLSTPVIIVIALVVILGLAFLGNYAAKQVAMYLHSAQNAPSSTLHNTSGTSSSSSTNSASSAASNQRVQGINVAAPASSFVCTEVTAYSSGNTLYCCTYSADNAGNLVKARLTERTGPSSGDTYTASYDTFGAVVGGYVPIFTMSMRWPTASSKCEFDSEGRPVKFGDIAYEYNDNGRLKSYCEEYSDGDYDRVYFDDDGYVIREELKVGTLSFNRSCTYEKSGQSISSFTVVDKYTDTDEPSINGTYTTSYGCQCDSSGNPCKIWLTDDPDTYWEFVWQRFESPSFVAYATARAIDWTL